MSNHKIPTTKLTPTNQPVANTEHTSVPQHQQANISFENTNDSTQLNFILEQLQISSDQLALILKDEPEFLTFTADQQTQIVKERFHSDALSTIEEISSTQNIQETESINTSEDVDTKENINTPEESNSTEETTQKSIKTIEDVIAYDDSNSYNSSFLDDPLISHFYKDELSVTEKKEFLVIELAKAEYLANGHSLEEFIELVKNEGEFSAVKAEAEKFIDEQINNVKSKDKNNIIPEEHILDELFAKTIASRQGVTIDEESNIIPITPKDYIKAFNDKTNIYHKSAMDNYQNFLQGNWELDDSNHMADFVRNCNTKTNTLRQFINNIANEDAELLKIFKKHGIPLELSNYYSGIEDFVQKYNELLKNKDIVEKHPVLQKYNTFNKIALSVYEDKIKRGEKLTEEEQRAYDILNKKVELQNEKGITGAKEVDSNLTTIDDFEIGSYAEEYKLCKTDEEKANFIWQKIMEKYADENGNISDDKREQFLKEIDNIIASAQHNGEEILANDYLIPLKGKFTNSEEKQKDLKNPWNEIDIEVSIGTGGMDGKATTDYGTAAGEIGDTGILHSILEQISSRTDGSDIINNIISLADNNDNISTETKQIYSNYASNNSQNTNSSNNTTYATQTISNQDKNNINYNYANQTTTNYAKAEENFSSPAQTSEEAIAQLDLQQEADQQKLIEIVSKDSSVISKLDPQAKKAVLEVYCKRLDGAQIFALFKKSPSLYTDLLKFSGEKLNLYKDQMFKILANGSTVNMEKLAKELGIDLIKFAKQNKEYAAKIAVATKNVDFAKAIIRNAAFYGLQMGSSEYFDLIHLTQKKNEELKQGDMPVYNEVKAKDIISRFTFKA